MRIGFNLPFARPDGTAPTAEEVGERARLLERIGFDAIWLGETISRTPTARPEVLAWLLVAAHATRHIQLGTAVLQLPLHHPTVLAQRLLTLHALTDGRFTAGVGAGSTRADYDAVGVDFERRFALFNAGLPVVRRLCNGDAVGAADLHPWPNTLGGPPIVIGAWASGLWVERAARDYDGWMGSGHSSLRELAEGMRRFTDAGGTRALVMTVPVDLRAPSQPLGPDEPFHLRCGPAEAAERLARLAELGFHDVGLVRLGHTEADVTEEDLLQIRALYPRE